MLHRQKFLNISLIRNGGWNLKIKIVRRVERDLDPLHVRLRLRGLSRPLRATQRDALSEKT